MSFYRRDPTRYANWQESDLNELQKQALQLGIIQRGRTVPSDMALQQEIRLKEVNQQAAYEKFREEDRRKQDQTQETARRALEIGSNNVPFQNRIQKPDDANRSASIQATKQRGEYELMPEQWNSIFKQQLIDDWKAKNTMSRAEMYKQLLADVAGTSWHDINSLIDAVPLQPGVDTIEVENNYYEYLVPWAAVRVKWAYEPHENTRGWLNFSRGFEIGTYLYRFPRLTGEIVIEQGKRILKKVDEVDINAFSYTALFGALGVLLITMLVKI